MKAWNLQPFVKTGSRILNLEPPLFSSGNKNLTQSTRYIHPLFITIIIKSRDKEENKENRKIAIKTIDVPDPIWYDF